MVTGVITKALYCADFMEGCDFVARGASEDEVMQKATEHARTDHGVEHMSTDMAEMVRSAIRDEQTA